MSSAPDRNGSGAQRAARIVVVMGGESTERERSLRSGAAVLHALTSSGIEARPLVLSSAGDALAELSRAELDVAFLALHGHPGDGCVQGALELLGAPYTGSNVLASALSMDALKAKEMFRLHGVPTPPYYVSGGRSSRAELEALHGSFGYPVIVKPRRGGSPLGVSQASDAEQLASAVDLARSYDSIVLVERFIVAKRVAVGLLDGRVLGAVDIASFSDLGHSQVKCALGAPDHQLAAPLPPARYRSVFRLAQDAARALGASGAVRVDLLVTEGQNEYVIEVDTLPTMTETSLFPTIARAAGFDFATLCEAIVRGAMLHSGTSRPALELARSCSSDGTDAPNVDENRVPRDQAKQSSCRRSGSRADHRLNRALVVVPAQIAHQSLARGPR